ncbi:hypothetical protein [Spirochaeta cellobiosiphila]|uniref:hypothetical protein n=1 Tax=Spirochaeta cellobiosiphila TaxID=504483 RepID=UPI00040376E4|nr:hypothetical protein [Spirochaeta cellobiosiphila]
MRNLVLILGIIGFVASLSFAQSTDTVDISNTQAQIDQLKVTNDNHQYYIDKNNNRKTELESRISSSESRLSEIEDSLAYAESINKELLDIMEQTPDKGALADMEKSRSELLSVRWLLRNEKKSLTAQVAKDKEEMASIDADNNRRNMLISQNNETITSLQEEISTTQTRLSEIEGKLTDLDSRLAQLREGMDKPQPAN